MKPRVQYSAVLGQMICKVEGYVVINIHFCPESHGLTQALKDPPPRVVPVGAIRWRRNYRTALQDQESHAVPDPIAVARLGRGVQIHDIAAIAARRKEPAIAMTFHEGNIPFVNVTILTRRPEIRIIPVIITEGDRGIATRVTEI